VSSVSKYCSTDADTACPLPVPYRAGSLCQRAEHVPLARIAFASLAVTHQLLLLPLLSLLPPPPNISTTRHQLRRQLVTILILYIFIYTYHHEPCELVGFSGFVTAADTSIQLHPTLFYSSDRGR